MKKVNLTNKKGVEVAQAIVDDDDYDTFEEATEALMVIRQGKVPDE